MSGESITGGDFPRVGLLGYGYWGKKWARVFEELGHLQWIFDTSSDALASAQRKYGLDRIAPNITDRLDEVDALVIAAPSKKHYQLARDAMIVGLDVLVEKPVALSVEKADRLWDIAENMGRAFLAGHTFMYSRPVHVVHEWIRKGAIGDMRHIRLEWRGESRERKNDVNALWNIGPHPASVLGLITGTPPTRAEAASGVWSSTDEVLEVDLYYRDAVTAHISISSFDPEKTRKITVLGSRGSIICEPTRGLTVCYRDGEAAEKSYQMGPEPLLLEAVDFIESVREGVDPASSMKDGLLVTETLEMIEESANSPQQYDIGGETFLRSA